MHLALMMVLVRLGNYLSALLALVVISGACGLMDSMLRLLNSFPTNRAGLGGPGASLLLLSCFHLFALLID
jgi:hypothetical protein